VKAHSVKCPSCGKQHVPGFAFCQRCGAALGAADEQHSASAHVTAPPVKAADDYDESDFQAVSPATAREIAASERKGCGTMLAALLFMIAVVIFVAAVV
jgi:hypothetical protein